MKLDRVTITGADDSINPNALVRLYQDFPFVEWGILVSKSSEGFPRFPTRKWVGQLTAVAPSDMRLSLHVCGRWVRQLLLGVDDLTDEWPYVRPFQRIQLNFHTDRTRCDAPAMWKTLAEIAGRTHGGTQFIFQVDGAKGHEYLEALYGENGVKSLDAVPLYDVSGGAGRVPDAWPKPQYLSDPETFIYHGYAGGLGPDTLERELPRIAEAAFNARIWIDMERRVRSEDDRVFDLAKVRRVLEICAPWVTQA